jgi:hypothetical protein
MVYGMQKTTIYLPDDLKVALEQAATNQGCSEADLIRQALRRAVRRGRTPRPRVPRPRVPLFTSGRRGLAERADKALAGFGRT